MLASARSSGSAGELRAEASLERLEAAEGGELRSIGIAAERGEHSGEVGGRRYGRADAPADRLAPGAPTEVVIAAARTSRLDDDLQLADCGA
jgi:hypothetical protein